MPVSGYKRYINLFKNISNPQEYLFKKSKRHKEVLKFITKPNRIVFTVPDSLYQVFKEIFMQDVYNIEELANTLPKYPVIIDIGANAGFFNFILLSKIKEAKIFSYEPLLANIQYFNSVIEENKSIKPFLSINQLAVTGKEKEYIELFMADNTKSQVVASIFDNFAVENKSKIKVPCISLSKIINDNNLRTIDLLKIDCEGSEYDIIYNTPTQVLTKANHIALEVHNIDDETYNFTYLKQYLESLNYAISFSPINNFCFSVNAVLNRKDE